MSSSRDIKNLGGRPKTGQGTPVMVRLQPELLGFIDALISERPDRKPTRPEVIRELLEEVRAIVATRTQGRPLSFEESRQLAELQRLRALQGDE